jgi:hypothetical protein
VKNRIVALGQENVKVDVVFDPPWHRRASATKASRLGL